MIDPFYFSSYDETPRKAGALTDDNRWRRFAVHRKRIVGFGPALRWHQGSPGGNEMKKNMLYVLTALLLSLSAAAPAGAGMVKEVVFGLFLDAPSEVEADRYYMQYHAPETIRISGPWLRWYVMYRPYDPPQEAVDRFGAVKGRYAELWFTSMEEYQSRPSHGAWSLPSWETDRTLKMPKGAKYATMLPALPTEEFYDPDPNPEQTPVIRWITAIRYPDGVSEAAGEDWFLNVHAEETLKQPGLLKFVSYKCLERGGMGNMPEGDMPQMPEGEMPETGDGRSGGPMAGGVPEARKSWVRVNEYWYTDFDAWRKAVIESPPEYTAPSWGGEYPFVEMGSTFIKYMPDADFLKGDYIIP